MRNFIGKLVEHGKFAAMRFGPLQRSLIYKRRLPTTRIKSPGEYGLEGFTQETLTVPHDGMRLGLWIKPREDDTKPVYVVFHGRRGHWGDVGAKEADDLYTSQDRFYRIKWLKALEDTGAGIIAVHPRGFGTSRNGNGNVGEGFAKQDMKCVADYVLNTYLPANHATHGEVIVAGESMGGALAAMLAEELSKNTPNRRSPPAMLGLIGSFASMVNPTAAVLRKRKDLHYLDDSIVQKVLHDKYSTADRLKKLDPEKTALYVANSPNDEVIPFEQEFGTLLETARHQGLRVKPRILSNDFMLPEHDYAHTSWNPNKIVAEMEAFYHECKTELSKPSANSFSQDHHRENGYYSEKLSATGHKNGRVRR